MNINDVPTPEVTAAAASPAASAARERPSLFHELRAMALALGPIGIVLTADDASDRMTMIVTPTPREGRKPTTLCEQLSLTGTPAEFEADFVDSLMNHRVQLASFNQQIAENHARVERAGTVAAANAAKPAKTPSKFPAKPAQTRAAAPSTPDASASAQEEGAATGTVRAAQGGANASQCTLFDLEPQG